jgi:hypothetical protein
LGGQEAGKLNSHSGYIISNIYVKYCIYVDQGSQRDVVYLG